MLSSFSGSANFKVLSTRAKQNARCVSCFVEPFWRFACIMQGCKTQIEPLNLCAMAVYRKTAGLQEWHQQQALWIICWGDGGCDLQAGNGSSGKPSTCRTEAGEETAFDWQLRRDHGLSLLRHLADSWPIATCVFPSLSQHPRFPDVQ